MAFCGKCGTQFEDGVNFCPSCGAPATAQSAAQTPPPVQPQQPPVYTQASAQGAFDPQDFTANKAMGVLAYIGILVLIPIFAAKESKYARFHSNQGLVLLIGYVAAIIAISILGAIFTAIAWTLFWIGSLLSTLLAIAYIVFVIMGIVNATKNEAKELPFIGQIKILK